MRETEPSRYFLIAEIAGYVKKNKIYKFSELYSYALENRSNDWIPLLRGKSNSAYLIREYISSFRRMEKGVKRP